MIVEYPDRETWLASRSTSEYRIGASDVAAILGVHPFKSPFDVWCTFKDPKPEPARPELADGTEWEAVAALLYGFEQQKAGRRFEAPQWRVAVHDAHPWLSATPDGWSFGDDGLTLWECKTLRRTQVCTGIVDGECQWTAVDPDPSAWPEDGAVVPQYGDDVNGPVPIWFWTQCQIAMACTGATSAVLEGWFFGFHAPVRRRVVILPEPSRAEWIIEKVSAWRDRYLLGDEVPPTRSPDEVERLARWRWPVKASERPATADEAELMAEILRLRRERDEYDLAMKHQRARLIESMGPFQRVWTSASSARFDARNVLTVK